MADLDLDALNHSAELASVMPWESSESEVPYDHKRQFRDAVTPAIMLELIRRLRAAEAAAKASKMNEAAAQEAAAGLEAALIESRADERQAMQYLQEVRSAAGHDGDFPSLVEAVRRMRAEPPTRS